MTGQGQEIGGHGMNQIGIIGAMDEEVAKLKEQMEHVRVVKRRRWSFARVCLAASRRW